VFFTSSSEKGKRKTPPELRHNTRLQQKHVKSAGPSGIGTDSVTLNMFFGLSICKIILNFTICLV
jgi:hypothetical protein